MLYVLLVITLILLVLEAGLPLLNRARDKSTFTRVKDTMASLDQHVSEISSEGQGSQRVIPLDVPDGEVEVADNKLRWKLETDSKLLEPQSRIDQGNIVVSADVDVTAREYPSSYIIENSIILMNITRYGSEDNWTSVNTSTLINYVKNKEKGSTAGGTFKFLLQNNESSTNGTGYTKLQEKGSSLTSAKITTHVNSTAYEYDLKITLDSKADFFRASIENFRVK